MSVNRHRVVSVGHKVPRLRALCLAMVLSAVSCSALNPKAVEVIFPSDIAAAISSDTIENARGHVVLYFINNTRFDGNVLAYLRDKGVDVDSDPDLRPRVRFSVRVLFEGGTTNTFEFLDGSDLFDGVDTFVDATGQTVTQAVFPPPELTEDTLTNTVLVCDVIAVGGVPEITSTTSSISVFVPTYLKEWRVVQSVFGSDIELNRQEPPGFRPLLVDDVSESGAVELQRNFGTRDIPANAAPTCGSVVVFVLTGDLILPFYIERPQWPGYLDTDVDAEAAIPGRFKLSITVR